MMYSIDMSAAFDLLHHDKLEKIMHTYSQPVRRSVMDYLSDSGSTYK